MGFSIAVSGKGGTGKTTLSAMLVRLLIGKSRRAVLAVDADPNACLGLTLGVQPESTIAELRDDILKQKIETGLGIGKLEAFGYACQQSVTEAKGFDLLTMGRPEGPGCYCAANNTLRAFLSQLSTNYGFVVTDNEAGMEHLSRRTNMDIDVLAIVAEPTKIGLITAQRILDLAQSLPIKVARLGVIWSRSQKEPDMRPDGIEVLGTIPYDNGLFDLAVSGGSIFELPDDNAALCAARTILYRILDSETISPTDMEVINAGS
jgi:CO dehydrogenase maturation factor